MTLLYIIIFMICFMASIIGAICGLGGGVIIKPALDAFGIMNVETVSFLSGCTVLTMSAYSVLSGKLTGEMHINKKTGFPVAMGAAAGGILGKWLFSYLLSISADKNRVGAIQAICLLAVTAGSLLYNLYKKHIKTHQIKSTLISLLLGVFLGTISAFLGIGGGPVNIVLFFFFFSMTMKAAVENSLYIIFFSQLASLITSLVTKNIPAFEVNILILMTAGGILGGIFGREINKRIKEETVERLFIVLMLFLIIINIYNITKFL